MGENTKKITLPISEAEVRKLKAGDTVSITGVVYTARDMAHKYMIEGLLAKGSLPMDVKGQAIYYTGPTPAIPGQIIGSCGPGSGYRMDPYAPFLIEQGLRIMIGKGPINKTVIEAMKKHGAVYLAAIGGTGAIIARIVKKAEVVAYENLGPDAILRLEVENFTSIVAIDSNGNNLYAEAISKFGQ